MKRSRFSQEQIISILKEHQACMTATDLCRKHGIRDVALWILRPVFIAIDQSVPMTIPQGVDQRWSSDFLSDSLLDGRRFRILCVIDDFSRECMASIVDN